MKLRDWFSQCVGYPWIVNGNWRRDKDRKAFKTLLRQKQEEQFAPLEHQQALQFERLKALLMHAGKNVPYYRDLFAELHFDPATIQKPEDIKALPILTREMIQDNQERLLVTDPEAYGARRNSTGGSTGYALNFYQGTNYKVNAEASQWLSDMVAGRRMGGATAYLWGSPRDIALTEGVKGRIHGLLRNERHFNSFDMGSDRMREYFGAMQRFQPEVLIAYASSLYIFARFLRENNLTPTFPTTSIITSAEVLFDDVREALEETFRVPVFDRYGSREMAIVAYECEQHQGLHLHMADQYVELIGHDPCREPAEMIVTNLHNYSMPFIRYRIGDLAIASEHSCKCGRSSLVLAKVIGRITDTITTKRGDLIHGAFFRHAFFGLAGIRNYQLIQESTERYHLKVVPAADFEPSVLKSVQRKILQAVGWESILEIEIVDDISPSGSGKHLFIISRVPLPVLARSSSEIAEDSLKSW